MQRTPLFDFQLLFNSHTFLLTFEWNAQASKKKNQITIIFRCLRLFPMTNANKSYFRKQESSHKFRIFNWNSPMFLHIPIGIQVLLILPFDFPWWIQANWDFLWIHFIQFTFNLIILTEQKTYTMIWIN